MIETVFGKKKEKTNIGNLKFENGYKPGLLATREISFFSRQHESLYVALVGYKEKFFELPSSQYQQIPAHRLRAVLRKAPV